MFFIMIIRISAVLTIHEMTEDLYKMIKFRTFLCDIWQAADDSIS